MRVFIESEMAELDLSNCHAGFIESEMAELDLSNCHAGFIESEMAELDLSNCHAGFIEFEIPVDCSNCDEDDAVLIDLVKNAGIDTFVMRHGEPSLSEIYRILGDPFENISDLYALYRSESFLAKCIEIFEEMSYMYFQSSLRQFS